MIDASPQKKMTPREKPQINLREANQFNKPPHLVVEGRELRNPSEAYALSISQSPSQWVNGGNEYVLIFFFFRQIY